jgi:hypothetical protein
MKIHYSLLLISLLASTAQSSTTQHTLTPPNAKAGECYARVVIPALYEEVEEKVLVKEAATKVTIVPAQYTTEEETIEVVPATKEFTVTPPEYEKKALEVEIKPEMKIWKTSLKKHALPVSPTLLASVAASGVNLKGVEAGSCFKEYYAPRQFKTLDEKVMVRDEYNETKIIEPTFEVVEKVVTLKPASKKRVEVPAKYKEVEEKILVEAEKTVWKKGKNPAQKVSGATGEIMCLVKVPAKYTTIHKRVLVSPATTKLVDVPAKTKVIKVKKLREDAKVEQKVHPATFKSIKKVVLEKEAKFRWVEASKRVEKPYRYTGNQICLYVEPAKHLSVETSVVKSPQKIVSTTKEPIKKTIKVEKLLTLEEEVQTPIKAEYKSMKIRKKRADTQIAWRRILCQTNMTKEVIASIQTALNNAGYHAGKADGVLGRGTQNALKQFQKDHHLATGGLTYETLDALHVSR